MITLKAMVTAEITKPIETMTSLEVVSLINKGRLIKGDSSPLRHTHFMEKVSQVLGKDDEPNFRSVYLGGNGQERKCYNFPRRETMLMLMSYSYELQAAVYDRMEELEQTKAPVKQLTYSEALRQLADEVEAKEIALLERNIAIETKAEIGHRREATAMNTASQAVKQRNALQVELDQSQQWSTIKRMEMLTGLKFNWRTLKSAGVDLGIGAKEVFDANYGTVKSYHADVWNEAYALDINQ